jgi:hypothetical protein
MPAFVWLPVFDGGLDQFAYELCDSPNSSNFGSPMMLEASPGIMRVADWEDIDSGDRLSILGHGMGRLVTTLNTDNIGWRTPDGIVKWTFDQLADEIGSKLGSWKGLPLIYELLICYGANKFFGMKSFGAKFATALASNGMRGSVWAYQGSIVMTGQLGGLVAHGTSRITDRFGKASFRDLKRLVTVQDDGSLDISHWNYNDAATQRVTWNIL